MIWSIVVLLCLASTSIYSAQGDTRRVVITNTNTKIGIPFRQSPSALKRLSYPKKPRFVYDKTKAWKTAFRKKDVRKIQKLQEQNHPKNTSLERQNALLAITSRTADPKKREALFNVGLDQGHFTLATAKGAAKAMARHAENLAALAADASKRTIRA